MSNEHDLTNRDRLYDIVWFAAREIEGLNDSSAVCLAEAVAVAVSKADLLLPDGVTRKEN